MKLTDSINDLLLDLSELEAPENNHLLIGDGELLRNNLLKLYRATDNAISHSVINQIMIEAGYPWFGKLAESLNKQVSEILQYSESRSGDEGQGETVLSEDEFMQLVPANGYFH